MTRLPIGESELSQAGQALQEWPHWVNSLLLMARQLRRNLGRKLAPLAITENDFLLLWQCAQRSEGASQSQLAAVLGVSPAQISGQVDKLKARGLLRCHRPPKNRRTQIWQFTPAGLELLAKAEDALKDIASDFAKPSLIEYLRRREAEKRPSSPARPPNLRVFSPDAHDEASAREASS
jgi:DNA-binding MarR family transcriptional regulator